MFIERIAFRSGNGRDTSCRVETCRDNLPVLQSLTKCLSLPAACRSTHLGEGANRCSITAIPAGFSFNTDAEVTGLRRGDRASNTATAAVERIPVSVGAGAGVTFRRAGPASAADPFVAIRRRTGTDVAAGAAVLVVPVEWCTDSVAVVGTVHTPVLTLTIDANAGFVGTGFVADIPTGSAVEGVELDVGAMSIATGLLDAAAVIDSAGSAHATRVAIAHIPADIETDRLLNLIAAFAVGSAAIDGEALFGGLQS